MTQKIVILGVGSTYFTRSLLEGLIRVGGAWDVGMVDIDPAPLDVAMRLGHRLAVMYGADMRIHGSVNRCDVLADADAVVSVVGVGGRKAWLEDLRLGRRHGIYQTTADTAGVGGLSRALRTVPVLIEIARDMERLCPDALLVNFTNPMTVNCRALARRSPIRVIGLCTGVHAFHHKLARLVGVAPEETECTAVGVNHFTWITKLQHGPHDLLAGILARAEEDPGFAGIVPGGQMTMELFRTFGAFPVVGDHHISEFIPPLLTKDGFYGTTLGFDGERDSATEYFLSYDAIEAEMAAQAAGATPIEKKDLHDPSRPFGDEDFFAELLLALRGERELRCTVNLPNRGQAIGLPAEAVVESTALVNGAGIQPLCCGEIPPGVRAILQRIIAGQELAAEAALRPERLLAVQALMADLTAPTRPRADAIVDDLLATHRAHLPLFS